MQGAELWWLFPQSNGVAGRGDAIPRLWDQQSCESRGCGFTWSWEQTHRVLSCVCVKNSQFSHSSNLTQPNRGSGTSGGAPTELGILFISVLFSARASCSYPVKIQCLYKITRISTGPERGNWRGESSWVCLMISVMGSFSGFCSCTNGFSDLGSVLGNSYLWGQREPHPGLWQFPPPNVKNCLFETKSFKPWGGLRGDEGVKALLKRVPFEEAMEEIVWMRIIFKFRSLVGSNLI